MSQLPYTPKAVSFGPDGKRCENCRLWVRKDKGADHGECRCNPPTHVVGPGPHVQHGLTKKDNWCGQHQAS